MSEIEQQRAEEWIDWAGGECPVDPETLVEIKLRDKTTNGEQPAGFWIGARCWWKHLSPDHANDIIAYRVVQP